jgi:hypothetical protein
MLFGQLKDRPVIDVTDHHDIGVVRRIPLLVPVRASLAVMFSRSFIQPMTGTR